jgi:hypothetical protein
MFHDDLLGNGKRGETIDPFFELRPEFIGREMRRNLEHADEVAQGVILVTTRSCVESG